jgi:hypothetical protein
MLGNKMLGKQVAVAVVSICLSAVIVHATSFNVLTATHYVDWGDCGISPDGSTIYGSFYSSSSISGRVVNQTDSTGLFTWNAATGLASLPVPVGSINTGYGTVRASNFNGTMLVGQTYDFPFAPNGITSFEFGMGAVSWTNSTVAQVFPVGTVAHPTGVFSRATGISDDGTVIAGYEDPDNAESLGTTPADAFNTPPAAGAGGYSGYSQGFLITPSGTVTLKDFGLVNDGKNVSQATLVSPDGKYAFGIARNGASSFTFTRWDPSGNPTSLTGGGFTLSHLTAHLQAVSADDNTVIGTDNQGDFFEWKSSGTPAYPLLQVSDELPMAISANGSFAVGNLGNNDVTPGILSLGPAVLIGGTSVGEPLSTYLTAHGVNFTGFDLDTVSGMSRDGTILVGTGHYATGQDQAQYVWEANLNIPEPDAGCALIFCAPVLLLFRRKLIRR